MTDIAKLVQEKIAGELLKIEADLRDLKQVKQATAAKILDVCTKTIRGLGIPFVEIKGQIYYRLVDLKAFQEARMQK